MVVVVVVVAAEAADATAATTTIARTDTTAAAVVAVAVADVKAAEEAGAVDVAGPTVSKTIARIAALRFVGKTCQALTTRCKSESAPAFEVCESL